MSAMFILHCSGLECVGACWSVLECVGVCIFANMDNECHVHIAL